MFPQFSPLSGLALCIVAWTGFAKAQTAWWQYALLKTYGPPTPTRGKGEKSTTPPRRKS
jgi:hypothetical protein